MSEKIHDRRHLGAISILLGNAGLFANGLIAYTYADNSDSRKAGMGRATSAVLYAGTGAIIARYGSSSISEQFERLEKKLAVFMQKEGISLDAELLQKADAETRKSWFAKLEDFAYDHPMECANTYNALATAGMLASGLWRRKSGEKISGDANLLNSLLVIAGTLVSVLVKERTPEQIAKKGDAGTLWGKIQQQPLNYAVWPFMGADLSYGLQAYGEYQAAQNMPAQSSFRNWALAMPAISAFVLATATLGDVLTGFSSKKPGGDRDERAIAQQRLIDSAAHILSAQPPQTQAMLTHKAAEYLAKQHSLRMVDFDAKDLEMRILQQVRSIPGQPPLGEKNGSPSFT